MGYMSDAALALHEKAYVDMLKQAEKHEHADEVRRFLTVSPDYIKLYRNQQGIEDRNVVVIGWNWLKWYPEFAGVKFVEDWMDRCDESDKDYMKYYAFIRIGEDMADIEERSSCDCELCDYISLVREVWVNNSLPSEDYNPSSSCADTQENEPEFEQGSIKPLTDLFG